MWTFNDSVNNFYIKKNNNLFKFKTCNNFINRWHESDEVELQRINEQTITAAFDPKVDVVTCKIYRKSRQTDSAVVKIHQLAIRGQSWVLVSEFLWKYWVERNHNGPKTATEAADGWVHEWNKKFIVAAGFYEKYTVYMFVLKLVKKLLLNKTY